MVPLQEWPKGYGRAQLRCDDECADLALQRLQVLLGQVYRSLHCDQVPSSQLRLGL